MPVSESDDSVDGDGEGYEESNNQTETKSGIHASDYDSFNNVLTERSKDENNTHNSISIDLKHGSQDIAEQVTEVLKNQEATKLQTIQENLASRRVSVMHVRQ